MAVAKRYNFTSFILTQDSFFHRLDLSLRDYRRGSADEAGSASPSNNMGKMLKIKTVSSDTPEIRNLSDQELHDLTKELQKRQQQQQQEDEDSDHGRISGGNKTVTLLPQLPLPLLSLPPTAVTLPQHPHPLTTTAVATAGSSATVATSSAAATAASANGVAAVAAAAANSAAGAAAATAKKTGAKGSSSSSSASSTNACTSVLFLVLWFPFHFSSAVRKLLQINVLLILTFKTFAVNYCSF